MGEGEGAEVALGVGDGQGGIVASGSMSVCDGLGVAGGCEREREGWGGGGTR